MPILVSGSLHMDRAGVPVTHSCDFASGGPLVIWEAVGGTPGWIARSQAAKTVGHMSQGRPSMLKRIFFFFLSFP